MAPKKGEFTIRSFTPVLVVDESHNAESELSVDMLRNLNPSFILDLTATPKNNSNIVSLVPAIELKKEHMVKLPVIVYNHHDKEGVVDSALHLQRKLEQAAISQQAKGGKYIRPIVLFQAQPKTKDDNITFENLKAQLISLGIPETQIKIKTANKDELKGIDLQATDCEVRYVITINALKEGWDCPFAYILASLADKSSEVDVTQILGRVLRQPYVSKHQNPMLNLSYVITASAKFHETLQRIVKGLENSGFTKKDYREIDTMPEMVKQEAMQTTVEAFLFPEQTNTDSIDTTRIAFDATNIDAPVNNAIIDEIATMAIQQSEAMEQQINEDALNDSSSRLFDDIGIKIKQYAMRQEVAELAKSLLLPQFVIEVPKNGIFDMDEDGTLLDRTSLLKGFSLKGKATDIDFDGVSSDLYKVDLEQIRGSDYKISTFKIEDKTLHDPIVEYILAKPKANQVKDIVYQVMKLIGKIPPHSDADIKEYVSRILNDMNQEQLQDFLIRKSTYTGKIKQRIRLLEEDFSEQKFNEWKVTGKLKTKNVWKFSKKINPTIHGNSIGNSLYENEGEMNGLEQQFIMEIASAPNIAFWHRNLGRGKGFALNGYKSDHYPDFIIVTKGGKVILVETKGADRDNSDSTAKLRLGKAWTELAGQNYQYMMVFDKNAIDGAYTIEKAKELIRQI